MREVERLAESRRLEAGDDQAARVSNLEHQAAGVAQVGGGVARAGLDEDARIVNAEGEQRLAHQHRLVRRAVHGGAGDDGERGDAAAQVPGGRGAATGGARVERRQTRTCGDGSRWNFADTGRRHALDSLAKVYGTAATCTDSFVPCRYRRVGHQFVMRVDARALPIT